MPEPLSIDKPAASDVADALETPPYRRIERDLRLRIQTGTLPVGSRLPGRAVLARDYGVALKTVEKAVALLLEDGTLRADSRRGTFVARAGGGDAAGALLASGGRERLPSSARVATLGILMHQGIEQDFWKRTIIDSLERVFAEEPGITRFRDIARPPTTFAGGAADLLREGVDALAVIVIRGDIAVREIDSVLEAVGGSVPTVFITLGPIPQPVPHIFFDQAAAGYQAARYVIDAGARRLLFLAPFQADWTVRRIEGARQAVAAAGLPATALRVWPAVPGRSTFGEEGVEQARRAAADLLAAEPLPPAVIGANDGIARGFQRAAADAGYAAGRDYLLIGFDDEPEARQAGLTSMRPPLEALGEETVRLLRRSLAGETVGFQIRLRSQIVPRASTHVPAPALSPTEVSP